MRAIYVMLLIVMWYISGHCPSDDDPYTADVDETDCQGVSVGVNLLNQTGPVGQAGNLCHVECSHRGRCDYETATCECFQGFSGVACQDFY